MMLGHLDERGTTTHRREELGVSHTLIAHGVQRRTDEEHLIAGGKKWFLQQYSFKLLQGYGAPVGAVKFDERISNFGLVTTPERPRHGIHAGTSVLRSPGVHPQRLEDRAIHARGRGPAAVVQ